MSAWCMVHPWMTFWLAILSASAVRDIACVLAVRMKRLHP